MTVKTLKRQNGNKKMIEVFVHGKKVIKSCKSGSEAPEDLAISTLYSKLHEASPSYETPEERER